MALVRVYCGLASIDSAHRPDSTGPAVVAAVVDDGGRLLDVCEIRDDPTGYARLGALLAERSSGIGGAAIATDDEERLVVSLLSAAGRPIAVIDDDSVDDFAERFADDESPDEIGSAPTQRRAVGLARALQAGALSAGPLSAPRELASYRPLLLSHAALLNGRHSAAGTLREVLRELYPAALRAFPDPADPLALAVLDASPEPGVLMATSGRRRDVTAADAVIGALVADGVGDRRTVTEAVTALRIAISETPRRNPTPKALTSVVAETVRQAIAAVRAYDIGIESLVTTLTDRIEQIGPLPASQRTDGSVRQVTPGTARRPIHSESTGSSAAPVRPARPQPAAPRTTPATPEPVSAPPTTTPTVPAQRTMSPAEAGEPFRATLTTAAINRARAERQRQGSPRAKSGGDAAPSGGLGPADYSVPVPVPTPRPEGPPPGSRANWPLVNSEDDRAREVEPREPAYPADGGDADRPSADARVTPPWLAEDLPPEPKLRLVEPPVADREHDGQPGGQDQRLGAPPLRLVEADRESQHEWADRSDHDRSEQDTPSVPPVPDEDDGDLLIFAATRSAWFTGRSEASDVTWSSLADSGWQAAEQAARPAVGGETATGLPRRIPQANLVPGSPRREDRPLRIVRDAARIAENTTGYFQGWRRGQQIGGYAVGGRPGRESAGGWDFSRDHEDNTEYEYRSARY